MLPLYSRKQNKNLKSWIINCSFLYHIDILYINHAKYGLYNRSPPTSSYIVLDVYPQDVLLLLVAVYLHHVSADQRLWLYSISNYQINMIKQPVIYERHASTFTDFLDDLLMKSCKICVSPTLYLIQPNPVLVNAVAYAGLVTGEFP